MDCQPVKIGGYYDHVHILCRFSKKVAVMDLLEEVKKRSSKWIKTKGEAYANFYWQDGYAAFSVNPSQLPFVIAYIANQHEHHSKIGFQDECRAFFKKYSVNGMCGIDVRGECIERIRWVVFRFIGRCPMLMYAALSGLFRYT